jgi:hypothetical protein
MLPLPDLLTHGAANNKPQPLAANNNHFWDHLDTSSSRLHDPVLDLALEVSMALTLVLPPQIIRLVFYVKNTKAYAWVAPRYKAFRRLSRRTYLLIKVTGVV